MLMTWTLLFLKKRSWGSLCKRSSKSTRQGLSINSRQKRKPFSEAQLPSVRLCLILMISFRDIDDHWKILQCPKRDNAEDQTRITVSCHHLVITVVENEEGCLGSSRKRSKTSLLPGQNMYRKRNKLRRRTWQAKRNSRLNLQSTESAYQMTRAEGNRIPKRTQRARVLENHPTLIQEGCQGTWSEANRGSQK